MAKSPSKSQNPPQRKDPEINVIPDNEHYFCKALATKDFVTVSPILMPNVGTIAMPLQVSVVACAWKPAEDAEESAKPKYRPGDVLVHRNSDMNTFTPTATSIKYRFIHASSIVGKVEGLVRKSSLAIKE